MDLMKNITILCLILIFSSVNGQESKYLILDQHHKKLKFHNLCVYSHNELVESLMSDKHGKILLNNKYLSPKYKLEIRQYFCNSDTIIIKDRDLDDDKVILATFNDSCLTLGNKVSKLESYWRKLDNDNKRLKKARKYNLDSIKVQVEYYKNKIKIYNHFKISSSKLEIFFFYKKDELISCIIEELQPYSTNKKVTEFYYENGIIIYEWSYCSWQTGILGNQSLGYNNSLTVSFLKKYIQELLKITTHNKG